MQSSAIELPAQKPMLLFHMDMIAPEAQYRLQPLSTFG
jgi:hypothetical protein